MTRDEELRLDQFAARVRTLIARYRQQQDQILELQIRQEELQQALDKAKAETEAAREDFARLKAARMMTIADGDQQEARQRIDRLVRRIDKCIALLGG